MWGVLLVGWERRLEAGTNLEEPCPCLQGWDSDFIEEDVCGPWMEKFATFWSDRQRNYRKLLAAVRVTLGGKLPLGWQQNWRTYATGSSTHYWQSSLLLAGKAHPHSDTVRARGKDFGTKSEAPSSCRVPPVLPSDA